MNRGKHDAHQRRDNQRDIQQTDQPFGRVGTEVEQPQRHRQQEQGVADDDAVLQNVVEDVCDDSEHKM